MNKESAIIPKRNYTIYSIIVIVTVIATLVTFILYNRQKEYERSIPILRGIVSEIAAKDIDEYLRENSDTILYVGVATDENSREVEEDLIKLRERRNIEFVYLNVTDVSDRISFFEEFNKKYANGFTIKNYPAFILIEDGKIVDLVQKNERDLNIGDIEQLLDVYEVKGEIND